LLSLHMTKLTILTTTREFKIIYWRGSTWIHGRY